MNRLLRFGATVVLALTVSSALALETDREENPHEVVRQASEAVMSEVEEAQVYAEEEPERFYNNLQDILDSFVDFRGFARSVMGAYASSERYRSLDKEGRAQLRDQLDRFTEVMRSGLVRTYGKGLLAFAGSRIELPELSEEEAARSRVAVSQLIYDDGGEPYVLVYHMGKGRDEGWKLRNLVIEDVNLGEIYRSQFESAARKYDGDIDQVIANWTAVEIDD
ncbi:toluene tolerance protein [Kineobactrum sediminis]|uniref:Toluene tolerance protein n=1 Tax=Kineobactrum sediminis TaxID=1905677 RepID=A0A2N5Y3E5_9GAMM|nr:ABC transporter substrate-binding protein [Kineobactrum sediminis]PLW82914.1 toluene tolerance protein [Kineobactrum sediminis]